MGGSVTLNRAALRRIRGQIGREAQILCAAIAERSGGEFGALQLELAYWQCSDEDKPSKMREMKKWIEDFDNGDIVFDHEAES